MKCIHLNVRNNTINKEDDQELYKLIQTYNKFLGKAYILVWKDPTSDCYITEGGCVDMSLMDFESILKPFMKVILKSIDADFDGKNEWITFHFKFLEEVSESYLEGLKEFYYRIGGDLRGWVFVC
jgi:hypothetical protein